MTDRAAVKNADRPSGVTSARPIRLRLTTASGRSRSERCRRGARYIGAVRSLTIARRDGLHRDGRGAQDRVYFAAEASARDEDQPVQLGGVEATEVHRDCAAEGMTGHRGARDPKRGEQLAEAGGKEVEPVSSARLVRFAVTEQVGRDDPKPVLGQRSDCWVPCRAVGHQPVQGARSARRRRVPRRDTTACDRTAARCPAAPRSPLGRYVTAPRPAAASRRRRNPARPAADERGEREPDDVVMVAFDRLDVPAAPGRRS